MDEKVKTKTITFQLSVTCIEFEVLADALAGDLLNEALNVHGVARAKILSVAVNGKPVKLRRVHAGHASIGCWGRI